MKQNNSQQDYNFNPTQAQNDRNVQEKLKELEAQVYQTTKNNTSVETESEFSFSEQISSGIKTVRNWFNNLPQGGKIIAGIVAILVGFSVLNSFLHLLTNLIILGILSLILYGLYKYLFSSSQNS